MKGMIKEYVAITAGGVIAAGGLYFFMLPGNIISGSITGLALILVHFIPISVSVMTLFLNIVCLLLGFLLVGKEFGAKTVYVSVLIPFVMWVFERIFPGISSLTNDRVLDATCFVILASIGQALMFQSNASSGGLDIIAKILNKYLHIDLGHAIIIAGSLVIVSSIFVYDVGTLILGVLATYLNGIVLDEYLGGFSKKKKVCILSQQYEKIQQYIICEIGRGVTLYPAKGGYSSNEYMELVTILDKNEYGRLMNYMQNIDPHAFITIATVNEVIGIWNKASI